MALQDHLDEYRAALAEEAVLAAFLALPALGRDGIAGLLSSLGTLAYNRTTGPDVQVAVRRYYELARQLLALFAHPDARPLLEAARRALPEDRKQLEDALERLERHGADLAAAQTELAHLKETVAAQEARLAKSARIEDLHTLREDLQARRRALSEQLEGHAEALTKGDVTEAKISEAATFMIDAYQPLVSLLEAQTRERLTQLDALQRQHDEAQAQLRSTRTALETLHHQHTILLPRLQAALADLRLRHAADQRIAEAIARHPSSSPDATAVERMTGQMDQMTDTFDTLEGHIRALLTATAPLDSPDP